MIPAGEQVAEEAPTRNGDYLSELADLLFLPEHRQRFLCMFAAYLDASGKAEDVKLPGQRALVLAGYVAPSMAWKRFGKKWRGMLSDFNLKFAHHSDFVQSFGQYEGWSEKKRRAYVAACTPIINETIHRGVVTAVLLKDYAKLVSDNPKPRSPYMAAGVECLKLIARWADEVGLTEPISYFFEAGDGHDEEILAMEDQIRASRANLETYRLGVMARVPKNDPIHVQLQAADFLAWEVAKYLKDTKLNEMNPRKMRFPLQALWEPGKLVAQWYDEERLNKLADHNIKLLDAKRRVERLFE